MIKFTNDTKVFKLVKNKADLEELRKDLVKLSEWAMK